MDLPVNLTMNSGEYKRYHESFMQNNMGSTPVHTFSYIFLVVICTIISSMFRIRHVKLQYVLEYIIIVVPMILGYTLLSDYIFEIIFAVATILCIIVVLNTSITGLVSTFSEKNSFKTERLLSLTLIRSLTYLITVFSILGVDFRIYPRFLAKTETYGYSVMDTGVGLFVLMSGLVHKDYSKDNIACFLKHNLKLFAVLSVLGITRFVTIKQLDYQEHVTEYGVHWNFFFTLAVSKVVSSIILYFYNSKDYSLILSVILILLHECLLYTGLESWVFSNSPRESFVSANREGICSCLGYVALYLAAVHVRFILLNKNVHRCKVLSELLLGAGMSWILTSNVNVYRPISRTLANFAYWSYLLAILLTVFTVFYFFEVLLERHETYFLTIPKILCNINYNGLLYFLSANLLTGAVNLSLRTLLLDNFCAISILNGYLISTLIIVGLLKKKGLKL